MALRDRITVSTEDAMRELEQYLDRLRRFQYDSEARRLLGSALTDRVGAWDAQIRARRSDPFTIVVAGEFKRGKSSFLNALLGEEIVPTDVVPETVTMNCLRYGLHKNEAVLSGGRRLTLSDDELRRPALERLMGEVGETIRRLDLWRPNEFLKDVRVIDTPGLNDVTDDTLDTIVAEALAQADAVVYVYSVTAPLSRSEQMYIRYSILPQRYTKLFLVGNFCDMMETPDTLERARKMMEERTGDLLPGEKTYLISALDELCRTFGQDRPCPALAEALAGGFDALKADVAELIEEKRTVVAADRMQRMARTMVKELRADLDSLEKGAEMGVEQIAAERERLRGEESAQSERLAEAQSRINGMVEKMHAEAQRWTADLIRRMETEDLSAYREEEISQYYSYYCVELLQTAAQECLELHREQLLEEMSDVSDDLGKNLAGLYATGDKINFSFRLNNKTWTSGDSVTLAITQVSGNALINAMTDLVGSMARRPAQEADKGRLIADIHARYPALLKEMHKKLAAQYAALARSACELLTQYYQDEIDRARGIVAQYEEASQKTAAEKRQAQQMANEMRAVLDALDEQVLNVFA